MDVPRVLIRVLEAGLQVLHAKLYHGNVRLLITPEAKELSSERYLCDRHSAQHQRSAHVRVYPPVTPTSTACQQLAVFP